MQEAPPFNDQTGCFELCCCMLEKGAKAQSCVCLVGTIDIINIATDNE